MHQHEGDDLLRTIRSYVTGRVPPAYEDLVTELVGRTVVLVMTTPEFYLHLTYVQELLAEIARLQKIHQSAQKAPRRAASPSRATKTPPRPVKSATKPPPKVKKATPRSQPRSRTGQFRKGASGH